MGKCKKFLMCLLTGAFAMSFSAGIVAGAAEDEAPQKLYGDEFLVGSWVSFYDTQIAPYEDQLADLAASGMNYIVNPHWNSQQDFMLPFPYDKLTEMNELYEKYGVYYLAHNSSPEELSSIVLENELNNCIGYYLKDEPSASEFSTYSALAKEYMQLDPSRFSWVGLYPNYAGSAALGGSYENYVRNWVNMCGSENLPVLSYDHYPFTQAEGVRSTFFSDMEVIRKVAYENGKLSTMGCTQMGSWNGMRRPTPEMARWNVNAMLAYGFKNIIHFNWVAPEYVAPADGGEGMLDFVLSCNGEKTDLYEPMQVVNWQTRQIGNALLVDIDCAHAYHTANVPEGAESLPKNFVVSPTDSGSDFILSVFYGKNGTDKYIALFNKNYEESVTAQFRVAASSGIEGLTRYTVDSFETLPDPKSALPAPGTEEVALENGVFSDTFEAGEIKFYRLEGENIEIPEALTAPSVSLESGSYSGEQTVTLTTAQNDADIYYTLDGSFPDPDSDTTYLCEDGTVTFGAEGENKYYVLRAVCARGDELSAPLTAEYFISDTSENIAGGASVRFYDKSFTHEVEAYNDQGGVTDGTALTDGAHNPFNEVYLKGTGWAVVDLGSVRSIDRLIVSFWNNWTFSNVIIQLSETPDFASCVTVYNSNREDSADYDASLPAGTSPDYQDEFAKGHTLMFEPVNARYVRVYNVGTGSGTLSGNSIWQEIEAYNHTDFSENSLLDTPSSDWLVSGGGNWTLENGVLSVADDATAGWDRSYVYTGATYKNFVLEGTFTITKANGSFVGFGLYKNAANLPVSADNGYYAIIENNGRVATYNNATEFGPRNIMAQNFNVGAPFTFRVVSLGEFFSISVNGRSVYTIRDERCDLEAGYISVLAAANTIRVENLWIMELEEDAQFAEVLYEQAADDKIAVERFTDKAAVMEMLPDSITMLDTGGNSLSVPVAGWHCYDYNAAVSGYYTFVGEISSEYEGSNPYGVLPQVRVYVRSAVDLTDLQYYYDLAKSLNAADYTADTWEQVEIYLEMAEDVMQDKFLAQSDIGVAVMRLSNAINMLENIAVDKSGLTEQIAASEEMDLSGYLSYSVRAFEEALQHAKEIASSAIASQDEIDEAGTLLESATAELEKIGDKSLLRECIDAAKSALLGNKTQASKSVLEGKITEGENLLNAEEVSEKAIEDSIAAITKAQENLADMPENEENPPENTEKGCGSSAAVAFGGCGAAVAAAAVAMSKKRKKY